MPSTIRITRSGQKFSAIDLAPTAVMREIGEGILARIRSRTKAGVDATGKAFRPLSKGYAEQKQHALGHSRADLMVSGRMLNDMMVFPSPAQVTLTFLSGGSTKAAGRTLIQRSRSVGAADKAFWHNVTGAGRARILRPFFDLNDDDATFAVGRLEAHLANQIR